MPEDLIARGATADVYAYQTGHVLKLFHTGHSRARVEEEACTARAVFDALQHVRDLDGRPVPRVPRVGEVVEAEGRYGIVYERIDGPSMLEVLWAQPELMVPLARLLAELQFTLHTIKDAPQTSETPLSHLPRLRERLRHQIFQADLPAPRRDAVLLELTTLCDLDEQNGLCLCHGDFHPGNVLLTVPDGAPENAVLIDWCDVRLGSPCADVARTLVLLQAVEDHIPDPAFVARVNLFRDTYLARYLQLVGGDTEPIEPQIHRWLPVIAAGRLSENVPPSERERLERQMTR